MKNRINILFICVLVVVSFVFVNIKAEANNNKYSAAGIMELLKTAYDNTKSLKGEQILSAMEKDVHQIQKELNVAEKKEKYTRENFIQSRDAKNNFKTIMKVQKKLEKAKKRLAKAKSYNEMFPDDMAQLIEYKKAMLIFFKEKYEHLQKKSESPPAHPLIITDGQYAGLTLKLDAIKTTIDILQEEVSLLNLLLLTKNNN